MIDPRIAVLAAAVSGAGLLGLGAWQVHAHGGGFRGFRHHALGHKFLDFVVSEKLEEIGATEAQKQKITEIKERLMKSGHALREGREPLGREVFTLLEKDRLEAAEIKALVHARAEEVTRFADEVAEGLAELHGLLTPEQRRTLLAEAREHLAGHRR